MPDRPIWHVGDTSPAITDIATVDGVAQSLAGKTLVFKMRQVGSDDLTVSAAAGTIAGTTGAWYYSWGTADLDVAGEYLVWLNVSEGTVSQDVGEALIEVRAHAPLENTYVELEEIKETLGLQGETFADGDLMDALRAASRAIDGYKGTRFYQATETRYYAAEAYDDYIAVDDLLTAGTVSMDVLGNSTWSETWVEGTDFYLDPPNAALDGQPKRRLVLRSQAGRSFPTYQRAIRVTGTFGWASVPPQVKQATSILAVRLFKRARETPYAIMSVVASEAVAAAHLGRIDPDVAFLLDTIPGAAKPLLV